MKYIDAEKLIKKVRFARDNFYKQVDIEPKDEASLFCGMYCDALLQQIQSLQQEQPEVDLEEFDKDVAKLWGRCAAEPNDSIACLHAETFNEVARHFFELGLNTRKV